MTTASGAESPRGVVVEQVASESPAAKAGIEPGDTIEAWLRAPAPPANTSPARAQVESPFDLKSVELEEAPRGPVTFFGRNGQGPAEWSLSTSPFGLTVRPMLDAGLLARYEEGLDLVKKRQAGSGAGLWRAAAAEAKEAGQPWVSVWLLSRAAEALGEARLWADADAVYEQAFRQAEEGARPAVAAHIQRDWGEALRRRSEWDRAETAHRQALESDERLGAENLAVAEDVHRLGLIAAERRRLPLADEHFRRALALREKLAPGSLAVAASLNGLGDVARRRGDLAAAEEHYRRALAIEERLAPGSLAVTTSLNRLGVVAGERGDLGAAEARFRSALENVAPEGLYVAEYLNDLAVVARERGDLAAAEEHYRRALGIRERLAPGSVLEAESLHGLALVERRKGRPAVALELLLRAIAALERQRAKLGGTEEGRADFLAGSARYYHDTIETQIELGQTADALHVLERSRARTLLALLAERDLLFTADLPAELARARKLADAEYDRVQADLARLNAAKDAEEIERLLGRLRDLRREQEEVASRIRGSAPRLASLQYPQPLDLGGIRAVLDHGTTLLAYSVGRDTTILFAVQAEGAPGTGLSVWTLPVGEKSLREKIEAFRALVQRKEPSQDRRLRSLGTELYDLLVRPAEARVASSERLLLSADGPLHSLPFAALVRTETVGGKTRRSFLVEWKPLSSVVSASVYAELKRARRATPSTSGAALMAFGDPRYPAASKDLADGVVNPDVRSALARGFSFAPLPWTREEVQAIAKLFPGSRTLLGEEATEERAKSMGLDARYVHFACHGYLDPRFPLNSGLALTIPETPAEGRDNGLLQAWEIFDRVRLDADLVTLSACGTALGKEMGGEGLLGLVRAFHYAGARSVLGSLWAVPDRSTAELMKRFYGHLRARRPRDEALRAAQVEMIRKGPSRPGRVDRSRPYHWAAFQLSGDSR